MSLEASSNMALGDPPQKDLSTLLQEAYMSGMQQGQSNLGTYASGTWAPYTPTTTTTNTPSQYYPYTVTYPNGGITLAGYPWSQQTDPLDIFMQEIGQNFVMVRGSFVVKGPEREYTIEEVLKDCRHVRYLKKNQELIIDRAVWDAIMTFVRCEEGYADLTPTQYLDKVFAPKPPDDAHSP